VTRGTLARIAKSHFANQFDRKNLFLIKIIDHGFDNLFRKLPHFRPDLMMFFV